MARRRPPEQPLINRILERIRSRQPEFRQDSLGAGFLDKLYMTRQQRLRLLRWGSYALSCLVALLLQDTIFSRIHILGATLDLPACVLLLITVIEGTESGSVFILIASAIYYFTGSAPGPYVVAALTLLGMGATLLRQLFWHRSQGSILLCACTALMIYEIFVFGAAIFSGLTHWGRFPLFALTGIYSCIVMVPLYPLIHKFGKIGGHTWKE